MRWVPSVAATGYDDSSIAPLILIAADPKRTSRERSDALTKLGKLSTNVDLNLRIDESPLPYFELALQIEPTSCVARIEILADYYDPPSGHQNEALAAECYSYISRRRAQLEPEHLDSFEQIEALLKGRGVLRDGTITSKDEDE